MSAPFTPGPWEVQTGGIDGDEYHDIVTVRGDSEGTDRILLTVEGTKRNAEANARLIAAAPDLYAALRRLRDAWCLNACDAASPDDAVNHLPECEKARAALAKAVAP